MYHRLGAIVIIAWAGGLRVRYPIFLAVLTVGTPVTGRPLTVPDVQSSRIVCGLPHETRYVTPDIMLYQIPNQLFRSKYWMSGHHIISIHYNATMIVKRYQRGIIAAVYGGRCHITRELASCRRLGFHFHIRLSIHHGGFYGNMS